MAIVRLGSSSQVDSALTIDTPAREDILVFARILYQKLSSLTYNKDILNQADKIRNNPTSQFELIMNLLDKYSENVDTPEFKELDTVIAQIDSYLGELASGTKIYPFQEDYQTIAAWIDPNRPSAQRNVSTGMFEGDPTVFDNVVYGTDNIIYINTGV